MITATESSVCVAPLSNTTARGAEHPVARTPAGSVATPADGARYAAVSPLGAACESTQETNTLPTARHALGGAPGAPHTLLARTKLDLLTTTLVFMYRML